MSQSFIMSRKDVANFLGISMRQVIRIEKKGKLKPIKLNDTENGFVYYKRKEVESLVGGIDAATEDQS